MEVAIWAKGVKLCRTCRMLPTSCLPCKVLRLTYLKPAKSSRHCQVATEKNKKKRLSKKWWTIILPLMNEIINNSTKECDQTCLPAFCSNSNYHHSWSFIIICHVHLSTCPSRPEVSSKMKKAWLIPSITTTVSQVKADLRQCCPAQQTRLPTPTAMPCGLVALWPCAF